METASTVPNTLVHPNEVPDKHIGKLRPIVSETYWPDVRFFRVNTESKHFPHSSEAAISLMEENGIAVNPGVEKLMRTGNFFFGNRNVPDVTYFALITPLMLGHHEPVSSYGFLRELYAHNLHCDGVRTIMLRTSYLVRHRHVEMFFQVASWPLQDGYILCISNTHKGNFLGMKKITISTQEHPAGMWLVML